MALICWCLEALTFEDMTQVPATSSARYFSPPPIWIRLGKNTMNPLKQWKELAEFEKANYMIGGMSIKKMKEERYAQSGLWHQGDPQRMPANHSQS